jgi:hypothetical protein
VEWTAVFGVEEYHSCENGSMVAVSLDLRGYIGFTVKGSWVRV